jgi:succinate-semialdehyde dehydrogenase/glutarate-semialdehyde dehydrogenase
VLKEPVGPVAAFTPWNFPINQIVRKLAAALTTGCSFLCKAPEETPASPAALFQCFVDAGVPPAWLAWCLAIRLKFPAT